MTAAAVEPIAFRSVRVGDTRTVEFTGEPPARTVISLAMLATADRTFLIRDGNRVTFHTANGTAVYDIVTVRDHAACEAVRVAWLPKT